jgi:hypothetical protein
MMPKKIDPTVAEILKKHGADPATDIWDCHGTWVAYHRTLEKIAASAGVQFDPPTVIESDSQSGVVALCVTGHIGERAEWSIGEATPKNNKNAYPYAMAEKRAKDRVIIKLVGLHGLYSEDEADDFKRTEPPPVVEKTDPPKVATVTPIKTPAAAYMATATKIIEAAKDPLDLRVWWGEEKANRQAAGLKQADVDDLKAVLATRIGELDRPLNTLSAG